METLLTTQTLTEEDTTTTITGTLFRTVILSIETVHPDIPSNGTLTTATLPPQVEGTTVALANSGSRFALGTLILLSALVLLV